MRGARLSLTSAGLVPATFEQDTVFPSIVCLPICEPRLAGRLHADDYAHDAGRTEEARDVS